MQSSHALFTADMHIDNHVNTFRAYKMKTGGRAGCVI